jgi:uncharacterized protein (TIGR03083 family)
MLKEQCDAVGKEAASLSEEQFRAPTRCQPWDIKALFAHMWRDLFRIPTALEAPEPPEASVDAVTYWTSYDPKTDAPRIAQHASKTADDYKTGRDLVEAFEELSVECFTLAASHPPGRRIQLWWGPRMRLDEFLKTRVLEIVVHGLDMTDALGDPPIATAEGVSTTVTVLEGLLAHKPPDELGWSDFDFIRKGTGREALTNAEETVLGPLSSRFPLLG